MEVNKEQECEQIELQQTSLQQPLMPFAYLRVEKVAVVFFCTGCRSSTRCGHAPAIDASVVAKQGQSSFHEVPLL